MRINSFNDIKTIGYNLDVSYSTIELDNEDGESHEIKVLPSY